MAPVVLQTQSNSATSGAMAVTLTATVTGSTLIVALAANNNPFATSVVTSGGLNLAAAAQETDGVGGGAEAEIWYLDNVPAGQTSVTATYASPPSHMNIVAWEVSGVFFAGGSLDQISAGFLDSASSPTVWGSGTTPVLSQASEIVVGASAQTGLSQAITGPSSPWVNVIITSAGGICAGTNIVSATTAQGYTGSTTHSGTDHTATVVATFRAGTPPVGSPDQTSINPGSTWLRHFKPSIPRRLVQQPPAGPDPANLPNFSDQHAARPGQAWMNRFKHQPMPQIPNGGGVSSTAGLSLPGPGISATFTTSPGFTAGLNLPGPQMSASIKVPVVITSANLNLPGPQLHAAVKVPVIITSANLNLPGPKIITPSFNSDLTQQRPGGTWLDHFKPGLRRSYRILTSQQYTSFSANLNLPGPAYAGNVTQYSPFPQFPLNVRVEILINGTWQDITSFVLSRDDIVITRGLSDETQAVQPSQMTLTLDNRDGRFSPNNVSGSYYPYLVRNTQIRCSVQNQASADGNPYSGYRFWGEASSILPRWDSSQSDVYCLVTVGGVLRRYIQAAPIGSTLAQYYESLSDITTPYAYWPCEDGSSSSEIASGLATVAAMTFTGAPQFSSDTSFGGSDPLPVISGSTWHGTTAAAANPPGTGTILQKFPGTYHFTAPPGVTQITGVTSIGGGGGGGDANDTTGGGGGGGGGIGKSAAIVVTPGVRYTYIVGTGGAPGASGDGVAGTDSSFSGDSVTLLGKAGNGGKFAGVGGNGGLGSTFNGGKGGSGTTGESGSSSSSSSQSLNGFSGATGNGHGGVAAQQSTSWTAPDGVESPISVIAIGGGGGGHGGGSASAGGGGGGGGGSASGSVDVTAGNSYTFNAGSGGDGGSSNSQGDDGAASGVNGDSLGCFGNGGNGSNGSGGGSGGGITVGSGSGSSGSGGGSGASPGGGFGGGGGGGGGSGQSPGAGQSAHPSGSQTRQPGSGGGNGGGGGWGTSSFPGGSGATTGATGGSNGGGGGGGGSVTATSGRNAGGGGPGFVSWSWTVSSAFTINPTGGGGGSSAGTSTGGAAGSSSGTGGSAPAGGGSGGSTGSLPTGSSPGGGGAGGVPDIGSGALVAGAGGAGQVGFSWSGGTTSPVAADIIRFALHVDSAGAADGAVLFQALTYGTIATLNVIYHTGGHLELVGINSSSVTVFDSGSIAFGADGNPLYMTIELTGSGSNVLWKMSGITPGAGSAAAAASGSVTGTVGNVSDIFVNPNGTVVDSGTALGQISVQTYSDTLVNLSPVAAGFAGEYAADRISRLCASQGIGFTLTGVNTDTPLMGPQQDDTLLNILQSCADFDRGQLFETRDQLGVGYRTRVSLQGQNPVLTADYSLATLAGTIEPAGDDQLIRNSIAVTRNGGASSSAQLTSGDMSILTPPNGVGIYSQAITVQADSDSQLANLAAWLLTVGTVSGYRFPVIEFDMARAEVENLFEIIPTMDIGDYIQVTNPPSFLQAAPIAQLFWGVMENLNTYKWTLSINCVPQSPYGQGNPPSW